MSRQRQIYPEIFTSEDFVALSHGARILFIGLFTTADDHGRGKGSPTSLKAAVFPADNLTPAQVAKWAEELTDRGMVQFYEVDGSRCYAVVNWRRWQNPKYVAPSKFPIPPPNDHSGPLRPGTRAGSARSPGGFGEREESVERRGEGREGREQRTACSEPKTASAHEPPPGAFPCVGTGPKYWLPPPDLLSAWASAYPDLDVAAEIRKAHAWITAAPQRRKTPRGMPKFIVAWLNRATDSTRGRPSGTIAPPHPDSREAAEERARQRLFPGEAAS